MSKAEYHIGADSGMAHIAKFILGADNLHLYINIRERLNDERFQIIGMFHGWQEKC